MSVRDSLTRGLSLDLVGPSHEGAHAEEVLPLPPSRWYLTRFLAPWGAPARQKHDQNDTQGELEYGEAGGPGDDDETTPEPRAARRSHFPSSMGLSVLVAPNATHLRVGAQWGDYSPVLKNDLACARGRAYVILAVPAAWLVFKRSVVAGFQRSVTLCAGE